MDKSLFIDENHTTTILRLLCLKPLNENLQVIDNLPRVIEDDPVVGRDRPHSNPVVHIELLENPLHLL